MDKAKPFSISKREVCRRCQHLSDQPVWALSHCWGLSAGICGR